ncbi:MAG: acyl carrier protein [Rickettsiales bacterium]|jgi:acyl carrier protein|nr:acyl carrier protein [Rickettsiales bacterium]
MTEQTAFELEIATLITETLFLEDIAPEDITSDMALFYDGVGLDSIDALELALAISKKYGIKIRSDDEKTKEIFASLGALAAYIEEHQE